MTRAFIVLGVLLAISACATAARFTLQDRFRAIGLSDQTADCMVDELEARLSSDDIQDLARYTLNLTRADSASGAIRSLMSIDNPRAVSAIGVSGVSCVAGFRL